jgi:hypothetical protein
MEITSSAFKNQERIPAQFTCEGDNVAPPLQWEEIPQEAVTLALLVTDPDAPRGTFTHWLAYNLPPRATFLPSGESLRARFPAQALEGWNDFGRQGYDGPCPPKNAGDHRYYFSLYALNTHLELLERVDREAFLFAIRGHIVDEAVWIGTYSRK